MRVHETNLTPSGKCQGWHRVVTIQRRVEEAAMLPSSTVLKGIQHVPVILRVSLKVDMTRMWYAPYPPL